MLLLREVRKNCTRVLRDKKDINVVLQTKRAVLY